MSKEKDTKKKGIKILILILIAAILIFGNKDLQKKISKKIKNISNNKKTLKIVDRKNIGYEENSNIRVYENSIVKWENSLIIAYDMKGKEKWERAITYEKPLVCLGENRIYVGEGSTGEIYSLDLDGNIVYKFEAKQPIDRIGERKNFLVLFIKNPQIEGINIIDEKGNLFANTTVKDGSVLNVDLNSDKSKFLLTTMDLSQGKITTNLSMYGSSGQILSTVEFKDQILTLINFVSEESAIILSNEGIYFMENNKILWKKSLPGLKDMYVDMDGKRIYLLYENATDDQYLLFHFKAIEVAEIHTNVNKAIQFEEKAIAIAGKNGTSQVLNFSTLYLDIGRYYHIQGNLGKALDYTKKSTGILQETQMQYSPNGIASLVQYARYLFENRQINETIRIYQNCLDIINVCFGDTSLTYGYIAQNLAAILASVNKSKAALIYYDKAIIALENLLGSEHEDVMLCKEQMHKLLATTTPVLLSAPALPMKITA